MENNCRYRSGVLCREQVRCQVCGWNPEISAFRKEKLRAPKPVEKGKKKSRPSGANAGSGNLRKA